MKYYKKAYIVFCLLIVLISIDACKTQKSDTKIDKAISISFSYQGRSVNITDSTDLQNIESLISKMQEVDKHDNLESIKGEINFEDGSSLLFLASENQVCVGEKCYEGQQQGTAIKNILNKYIYDSNFITKDIQNSKTIQLLLNDTKQQLEIKDKEELLEKFENSAARIYSEPARFVKKYPDYRFIIKENDGSQETLFVINEQYLILSSPEKQEIYSVNDSMWNFATSLIPSTLPSDKNKIDYLYNAKSAIIQNSEYNGDYSKISLDLVRALIEGSAASNILKTQKILTITFTVNNQEISVDVYKDCFRYNNQLFKSEGVGERILSTITAG